MTDRDRETLERLQRWIRSAGTEYEEPPPPQRDADNAIRSLLEDNERLRAEIDADRVGHVNVRKAKNEVIKRIKAALALLSTRRTYSPECSCCRELIAERGRVAQVLAGGSEYLCVGCNQTVPENAPCPRCQALKGEGVR